MSGWNDRLKDDLINRHILDDSGKNREVNANLPTAQEIEAAPPSPIAQWLARSIVLLLASLLAWSLFEEVDFVASAQGKILPGSRVIVIQSLQKGVIRRILVNEGEQVAKGQVLIELDSVRTNADEKRLDGELTNARIKLAVNEVLLKRLERKEQSGDQIETDRLDGMKWSGDAGIEQTRFNKLLQEKWLQYPSRIAALVNALEASDKEYEATKTKIAKLENILSIITKRAEIARGLDKKEHTPETDHLQLEQARMDQSNQLAAEKQHLTQLQAMRDQAQQQIETLKTETMAGVLSEITQNRREIATLQEELVNARDMNQHRILHAPVSGRVQELVINREGDVVTEAEPLMKIVPDEESLVVEVFLENKDIGFFEKKMPAEVKIHTFPFSRYGAIEAEVETISDEAIFDEKRGYTYSMQLAMKKKTLAVDGKEVRLMPGMEVTAEIKTGERRLIEYFLAPLLRHGKESLRER